MLLVRIAMISYPSATRRLGVKAESQKWVNSDTSKKKPTLGPRAKAGKRRSCLSLGLTASRGPIVTNQEHETHPGRSGMLADSFDLTYVSPGKIHSVREAVLPICPDEAGGFDLGSLRRRR